MIEHEQQRGARPDADRAVFRSALILVGSGSIIFIARTAFSVQGRVCFSLFDDAMISMRYARNLAAGAGLVWNAGQPPVEVYTNFLWTVFMAALHLLPIPIEWLSLLVSLFGAACLTANLFI